MLTIEQVKQLSSRSTIFHQHLTNSDGTPLRVRVNGAIKIYKLKSRLGEFTIPIKYGLYQYGYVTHENAKDWCFTEEDAMLHPLRKFGDWNEYTNKTGMRPTQFFCAQCKKEKPIPKESEHSNGYLITPDNKLLCYECSATITILRMKDTGHTYLYHHYPTTQEQEAYWTELKNKNPDVHYIYEQYRELKTMAGITIARSFRFYNTWHPTPNGRLVRVNMWFKGPDNTIWYGYMIGDNTHVVHCQKTKRKNF